MPTTAEIPLSRGLWHTPPEEVRHLPGLRPLVRVLGQEYVSAKVTSPILLFDLNSNKERPQRVEVKRPKCVGVEVARPTYQVVMTKVLPLTAKVPSYDGRYLTWVTPPVSQWELLGTEHDTQSGLKVAKNVPFSNMSGWQNYGQEGGDSIAAIGKSLVADLLMRDRSPHRFNPPSGFMMLKHFLEVVAEAMGESAPESTKGIDASAFRSWSRFCVFMGMEPVRPRLLPDDLVGHEDLLAAG